MNIGGLQTWANVAEIVGGAGLVFGLWKWTRHMIRRVVRHRMRGQGLRISPREGTGKWRYLPGDSGLKLTISLRLENAGSTTIEVVEIALAEHSEQGYMAVRDPVSHLFARAVIGPKSVAEAVATFVVPWSAPTVGDLTATLVARDSRGEDYVIRDVIFEGAHKAAT